MSEFCLKKLFHFYEEFNLLLKVSYKTTRYCLSLSLPSQDFSVFCAMSPTKSFYSAIKEVNYETSHQDVYQQQLERLDYYFSDLDPHSASDILSRNENGTFLLRGSKNPFAVCTLSVRIKDCIMHVRIFRNMLNNGLYLDSNDETRLVFADMISLLDFYKDPKRHLRPVFKDSTCNEKASDFKFLLDKPIIRDGKNMCELTEVKKRSLDVLQAL